MLVLTGRLAVRIAVDGETTQCFGPPKPDGDVRRIVSGVASSQQGSFLPDTTWLAAVVRDEVCGVKGVVARFNVGRESLDVRAFLPATAAVRWNDLVQGGVSVRVRGAEVHVCRCLLRKVCANILVMPPGIALKRVPRARSKRRSSDSERLIGGLREAFRESCSERWLAADVEQFRSSMDRLANPAVDLLPRLNRLSPRVDLRIHEAILHRFRVEADASLFGLMNAVTSVARDEIDSHVRSRLEELGGAVAVSRCHQEPTVMTSWDGSASF